LRIPWIVAVVTSVLVAGLGDWVPAARAQAGDADSVVTSPPDTLRAIVVDDSLGIPGTLKGETVPPAPQDPAG
jgi:hypothetical protein